MIQIEHRALAASDGDHVAGFLSGVGNFGAHDVCD